MNVKIATKQSYMGMKYALIVGEKVKYNFSCTGGMGFTGDFSYNTV
jgi:hypothetical protein